MLMRRAIMTMAMMTKMIVMMMMMMMTVMMMKMITSTASRMESMGKELKHLPMTVITFGWSTFAHISCS